MVQFHIWALGLRVLGLQVNGASNRKANRNQMERAGLGFVVPLR